MTIAHPGPGFPPGPPRLRINNRSGRVIITAEERSDVLVEAGMATESDDAASLAFTGKDGGTSPVELRCPAGCDILIGTLSGRVEILGRAGAVVISTASGKVLVKRALSADIRTVSGDVEIVESTGQVRVQAKSGKTRIGRAAAADLATVSGTIAIDRADGAVRVKSVSGNVDVSASGPHNVSVQTISGSVRLSYPSDTHPSTRVKKLSGKLRNALQPGADCECNVSTVSGSIELAPA